MDAVARLMLRMSPIMPHFRLKCPLNGLICHSETITHNNWYSYIGRLNWQWILISLFYLSTDK